MNGKIFVDVNVIQALPPSCVNRDDTGSPKSAMYGGVRRARVSSQSWKKAVRNEFRSTFDESKLAYRTKRLVELVSSKIVQLDPSIGAEGAEDMARKALKSAGVSLKKPKKGENDDESGALFFISNKQAENLARFAINGCNTQDDKEIAKAAKAAIKGENGVEISLFGRMVADDPSLNVDASCQVAHAISTHKVDNEYDYYTAVDDKAPEDNAGAGMIGTVEFNSSTMYRYATVAVHALESNLDNSEMTAYAVEEFVRAFVLSMPSGKMNTFANHTIPYAVYIAVRKDRPVNLIEAFENPVRVRFEAGGYNSASVEKMVEYEKRIESSFVDEPETSWCIGSGLEMLGEVVSLNDALDGLSNFIKEAVAASKEI